MRQLALVAVMGCSFATTGAPSRPDRTTRLDCTTSSALPLLDSAAAVALAVIGVQMVLARDSCPDGGSSCEDPYASGMRRGGFVVLGLGALYTAGAVVGFSHVSSCKAAIATQQSPQRP